MIALALREPEMGAARSGGSGEMGLVCRGKGFRRAARVPFVGWRKQPRGAADRQRSGGPLSVLRGSPRLRERLPVARGEGGGALSAVWRGISQNSPGRCRRFLERRRRGAGGCWGLGGRSFPKRTGKGALKQRELHVSSKMTSMRAWGRGNASRGVRWDEVPREGGGANSASLGPF